MTLTRHFENPTGNLQKRINDAYEAPPDSVLSPDELAGRILDREPGGGERSRQEVARQLGEVAAITNLYLDELKELDLRGEHTLAPVASQSEEKEKVAA